MFNEILKDDIPGVKRLIRGGIDINKQYDYGQTFLMYAVYNNRREITRLLIESGADINIKDDGGNTAITYAELNKNKVILKMLDEYIKQGGENMTKILTVEQWEELGEDIKVYYQYCGECGNFILGGIKDNNLTK